MQAKPRIYTVPVTLGVPQGTPPAALGFRGEGSVTIQNVSFILKRITFGLISQNGLWIAQPNYIPNTFPAPWAGQPNPFAYYNLYLSVPDGMFLFKIYSTDILITPDFVSASGALGGMMGQDWMDLVAPVEFRPKDVITVEMINQVVRYTPVTYQILLQGVEPLTVPEKVKG